MSGDHPITLVVDGYRGRQDDRSGPLESLDPGADVVWNEWVGPGDSLSGRLNRLVEWNADRSDPSTAVNVVGLSMGCQIAARFSKRLDAVGDVVLVAPDPKARPVARDETEVADGIVSAYQEAQQLWGGVAVPADAFAKSLVTLSARAKRVRIVYCATDGVAEWDGNVESLVSGLDGVDRVELIEAVDGERVDSFGATVDLSAAAAGDVHERLWSATRL